MRAIFLSLFLSVAVLTSGAAQTQKPAAAKVRAPSSLQQQYNSIKFRSSPYKEFGHNYRVMRESYLDDLMKNVQDSLRQKDQSIKNAGKETAQALAATQKELAAQKAKVQTLTQANAEQQRQIAQTDHDVAHLSVLGLEVDKQVYVVVSLLMMAALAALAVGLGLMYKNSNSVTQEKILAHEEVSEELKNHRQSARERETKLKREQQSEANKVEELTQQVADLQKRVML